MSMYKGHFNPSWVLSVADVTIINPRRACAARVRVVVLCVCLSTTILAPRATRRLMSDTNRFSATRAGKIMWRFFRNDVKTS